MEKLTVELRKAHKYAEILSTNLQELEDAFQNEVLKNQEQLIEAKNETHSLLLDLKTNRHTIVADKNDNNSNKNSIPNESVHPIELENEQQHIQATGNVAMEINTADESINGVIGDTDSLRIDNE